ncbi:MAG: toll/interleukin-1 receptor domain-containing protein [Bacteroidales bacterium]|nr:toll/interleukin-1 receptor domain-containing protein [Bacteroidales bacterium]
MSDAFKYVAFISYNSRDTEWGKRLQRKLEHYRLPATLCSQTGHKRTPLRPVFFAATDIQPGGLSKELQDRLKASRNLIVICSPNSAQSEWVGKEIAFFHSLGRADNIHFFIVDGIPGSGNPKTECFNPIVQKLGFPEILGVNIHERIYRWPILNRERAYIQLISKLLGVEFDSIWQRHRRQLTAKIVSYCLAALAIAAALVCIRALNRSVDVTASLIETSAHNGNLPPLHDAVVTLTLDNEAKCDTVRSLQSNAVFNNIPHRFIGKPVRISVVCPDYCSVDTTLTLSRDVTLPLRRDPSVYGIIRFLLYDPAIEEGVPGIPLLINGLEAVSDEQGCVVLSVPLERQSVTYAISSPIPLSNNIITMPCGANDVVLIK